MSIGGEILSREYVRMVFLSDNNGKGFACYAQSVESLQYLKELDDNQKEL